VYSNADGFGTGNFFDFRSISGVRVIALPDIPYDFIANQPSYIQPRMRINLRARQWESGYVPGVHDKLLSSNLYSTLLNIRSNKLIKGGYKYDGDKNGVELLKNWDEENDILLKIKDLGYCSDNLGWAFVKLDIINGNPVPTVIPGDQVYFSVDGKNKICDFKSITTFIAGNDKDSMLMLMEHRYFKNGKPYIRYFFTSLGDQYGINAGDLREFSEFKEIKDSKIILAKFGIPKERYSEFKDAMNERELPFKTLGVEMVRGTIKDPLFNKLPIGQSLYQRIGEDLLTKYDIYTSLQSHEGNTAPRIVLVPQEFNNGGATQSSGTNTSIYDQIYGVSRKLGSTYFVKSPFTTGDGTSAEPQAINWEIRKSIIEQKGDILREIALNCGMSPENLNILGELNDDKSGELTDALIQEKRELLKPAIRMMIKEVLHFYGLDEFNVRLRFLEEDQKYFMDMVAPIALAVKNFLISPKEGTRRLLKGKTNAELDVQYEEIEDGRQKIIETYYAGGSNENNTIKELDKKSKDGENG
jgi:hypothetical protein